MVVDLNRDDTWKQWQWMKRYRIWEADREVFLYPENWLIESQRPNRTEIFEKLEQEIRQNESTTDHLETVGRELHRAARRAGSPVRHRHLQGPEDAATSTSSPARSPTRRGTTTGPSRIAPGPGGSRSSSTSRPTTPCPRLPRPAVPVLARRQGLERAPPGLPAAQASPSAPSQEVARYVSIGLNFSIRHSDGWAPGRRPRDTCSTFRCCQRHGQPRRRRRGALHDQGAGAALRLRASAPRCWSTCSGSAATPRSTSSSSGSRSWIARSPACTSAGRHSMPGSATSSSATCRPSSAARRPACSTTRAAPTARTRTR